MRKVDYIIALLERIAYQTAHSPLDFEVYLERTVRQNGLWSARKWHDGEKQKEKGRQTQDGAHGKEKNDDERKRDARHEEKDDGIKYAATSRNPLSFQKRH